MEPNDLLMAMLETIEAEARLRVIFADTDLRMLRGDRTQTSMSYKAEVPQSVLSRIENGEQVSMSLETMTRVLRAYLAPEPVGV